MRSPQQFGSRSADLCPVCRPFVGPTRCILSAQSCWYMRACHRLHQRVCCYVQVSAEALRVTEQMIHIIRPDPIKAVPTKLKVPCPAPEAISLLSCSLLVLLEGCRQLRGTPAKKPCKHSKKLQVLDMMTSFANLASSARVPP